jgi:prolyl oligopeptidase
MQRVLCGLLFVLFCAASFAQAIHGRGGITLPAPPAVQQTPVTDNYSGTKVVDNYRWLEDAKSPETRAFIDAENAYTARYFKQDRVRDQIADDLDQLERVSKWTLPIQRGNDLFFTKRLAGEGQASIYVRHGWTGKDVRLVDPVHFSQDPNTSVDLADVSRDGSLLAYTVRQGGADENTVRVFNVKTGKTLPDELPSALYFSASFTPDATGLFYSRCDDKGCLLYEHTLGARVSADTLLFGHEFHGELLGTIDQFWATVTDDGHYLVVEIDRGTPAKRVDIVYRDLTKKGAYFDILVWGLDARFSAIYAQNAWYVKTDYQAANSRILRADPGIMPDVWKTIVPEGADAISDFTIVGNRLFVQRLHDVKPETAIYTLDGKASGTVPTDGIGSISSVYGRTIDRYAFYSFESFIQPPTLYRLDPLTGRRDLFAQPKIPFDTSQFELRQEFYTSKDGTRIPIFIAGKKGLKRDGSERLLMTGYGGFLVNILPEWSPMYAEWLQQGGWFALPNLRGGGEYGERWHEQGMFEKKQNVFDDFLAAAEYLIAQKYTSPEHFAIEGRSNGGLLMGAAIVQRPELFSAVLCGYPLLDMLRYQKFLQGPQWTTEYGSAADAKQFPYLLRYSPYQNVKKGTAYPAVLFFTGADDTRVDPLHARKMTALLQSAATGGRPVLLHYSLVNGHSAGIGVDQSIQDHADMLAFLWTETGSSQH